MGAFYLVSLFPSALLMD